MMTRALALVLVVTASAFAQVSFDRLLQAEQEPQNWLTYSGDLRGHRYSRLTQITPENVRDLEQQWVFQAQSLEKFEATPLVVDGVMYTVQAPNDVIALDAVTGRVFWTYSHTPSLKTRPCCGRVNRGLAILGDTVYLGALDGRVIALDAKTGLEVWNVPIDGSRPEAGYAVTVAPLVVKDKVILGVAGGEYGIRGFIAAFDARTGKEVWRFYTIPAPGEPGNETWAGDSWKRGGAPIWVTGTYDRESNLTYWGIGNPGPDHEGSMREGDNLYSDSVVALDADTGKLRWHFQFSPNDEFDYDSTQIPVLADLTWRGQPLKAMLFANRNGFFYVFERTTGRFLSGTPFAKVNWANGLSETGRPNRVLRATVEGTYVEPGVQGATNWYSPSFSPRTGLLYVPTWQDTASIFIRSRAPIEFVEGRMFNGVFPRSPVPGGGGRVNSRVPEEGHAVIRALDPQTGAAKWDFAMTGLTDGGVMATASDLVFTGGREGHFMALDARTGVLLWRASLGGAIVSGPMSYSVRGRQYVAISAGNALVTFALRQPASR